MAVTQQQLKATVKTLWPDDNREFAYIERFGGREVWHTERRLPDIRRGGVTDWNLIVIHSAENKGGNRFSPDAAPHLGFKGAESVCKYALSLTKPDATRTASWPVTTDPDSILWQGPETWRTYHVHRYSESSVGLEMAFQAHVFPYLPDWIQAGHLRNAARVVGGWCWAKKIPPVYLDRKRAAAGEAGISPHGWLDPTRRSDPGVNGKASPQKWTSFPSDRFLSMVEEELAFQQKVGGRTPVAYQTGRHPTGTEVADVRAKVAVATLAPSVIPAEKPRNGYTPAQVALAEILHTVGWHTEAPAVKAVQEAVGAKVDGIYGPDTARHCDRYWKKILG